MGNQRWLEDDAMALLGSAELNGVNQDIEGASMSHCAAKDITTSIRAFPNVKNIWCSVTGNGPRNKCKVGVDVGRGQRCREMKPGKVQAFLGAAGRVGEGVEFALQVVPGTCSF